MSTAPVLVNGRAKCPLSFDGVLPLPLDLRHARARRARFHRRARVATRSTLKLLAEGVGFEPTVGYPTAVFKTAAFVHSATPPRPQDGLLKPTAAGG